MGEYASLAVSRELGVSWDEAHEMLYGEDGMSGSAMRRCPICGKRSGSPKGVLRHATAVHTKPQHVIRIETWKAQAMPEATP